MADASPTQKRLMIGLFAIAIFMTLLGIAVIWFLAGA